MQATTMLRLLLAVSGIIALAIGMSILFVPAQFHAANGIRLVDDASLFSELRAPGGALAALGALMLVGVFVQGFARTSLVLATTVYLAYGISRLVGMALDGVPGPGLVGAMVIELVIGVTCAVLLFRSARPGGTREPPGQTA